MTLPNPPVPEKTSLGTARYSGSCSHGDPDAPCIASGDDVVFWLLHGKWRITCIDHARSVDLLPDGYGDLSQDPTAVADGEVLCDQCFLYHRGECP